MTKLITSIAVAMMLTGATAAMADNRADRYWTDQSKPCGGFSCNSQQGERAFWDQQQDQGH
jgi:hypothetical protein